MATTVRASVKMNRGKTGIVGIATSDPMKAALLQIGLKGARHAESIASKRTGRLASNFKVTLGTRGSGRKKRAQMTIKNATPYAAAQEWGTQDRIEAGAHIRGVPANRALGRTQSWLRGTS